VKEMDCFAVAYVQRKYSMSEIKSKMQLY